MDEARIGLNLERDAGRPQFGGECDALVGQDIALRDGQQCWRETVASPVRRNEQLRDRPSIQ